MSMSGRILKVVAGFKPAPRLTSPARLAPLLAGSLLLLLASVESRAQPLRDADPGMARGRVERLTTAPRGEVDGAVLEDGTRLHWPPHMQDRFTGIIKEGDRVRASGRTETGPAGDTHFEVQSVTNLRTNATAENPDFANGPPLPPFGPRGRLARANRGAAETSTAQGRIDRFTTAPRGEIDGAVLEDGTWLHWPPHMQDRFTGIIKEGDRVRASGRTETGPAGDTHFEVQGVTNLRTNVSAENPDFAAGPPPPPGPRRVAPDRKADREQRLRDLENQVEQLLREIQRLRRER